jgi:hypothetical protein
LTELSRLVFARPDVSRQDVPRAAPGSSAAPDPTRIEP